VNLRIVTTPLARPLAWPAPRAGGLAPALAEAFVPVKGTEAALERLRQPGSLAVTTGQQPGLFGGPLYTIHKALSAVMLARFLEARWRRPVVPVFWSAGDDHDFAEANHAAWLTTDGTLASAVLRERSTDAVLTPLYREPLGAEIEPLLERLAADLPVGDARDQILARLKAHYRPEATMAESCTGFLAELLAPFGMVVFDATRPAAKQAQVAILLDALRKAEALERALVEQDAALKRAGEEPGVLVGDGATLVMVEGERGRDRLVRHEGRFRTRRSGEEFTLEALSTMAAREPRRFSANVLLRPVVESALLPTVAYVAGPGELRYLPLTAPLYPALGVPRQLPLPRWSGVVVEPRVDRVLKKFGASLEELLQPAPHLENRVIREQLPAEVQAALPRLRQAIETEYELLTRAAIEIDPTIGATLRNLKNQALAGTREAEKRLVNHLRRRQAVETQQIARAREAVLPDGKPQERVLSVAPWLGRHGLELMDELAAVIADWYRAGLEALPAPA
jgi:bacillithiol biosynthesis cysteine-adding enzyme BshC